MTTTPTTPVPCAAVMKTLAVTTRKTLKLWWRR
jgi:hypothetical protein